MAYQTQPYEFRKLLQSYLDAANERIREERPDAGTLAIESLTDSASNGVDEGAILLKNGGQPVLRSVSVHRLRMEFNSQTWQTEPPTMSEIAEFFNENVLGIILLNQGHILDGQTASDSQVKALYDDPESALQRIYPAVCNTRKNRRFLEDKPHYEIFDLSVYYVVIADLNHIERTAETMAEAEEKGRLLAKYNVGNRHLEKWNASLDGSVTENTLFMRAFKNAEAVHEILSFTFDESARKGDIRPYDSSGKEPGVSTNKFRWYGASSAFLQIGLDQHAGAENANLYLLPSSIHETILLPDHGDFEPKDLARTVARVNRDLEDPSDYLSDSVYYYDRKSRTLSVAYDAEAIGQKQRLEMKKTMKDAESAFTPPHAPNRGRR